MYSVGACTQRGVSLRAEGVGVTILTSPAIPKHVRSLASVLFRWDAPLFFANAEFFKERILDAVTKSPSPVRWVVVAAEPVTSVDVTAAADTLTDLSQDVYLTPELSCTSLKLKIP